MYKTTEITNILRTDISATRKTFIVVLNDACELLDTDKQTFVDRVEVESDEDLYQFLEDNGYDLLDGEGEDYNLYDGLRMMKVGESITSALTHPFNGGSSSATFICIADKKEEDK